MLFHSTRGGDKDKDFASILMQGLADDGGLFMPDHWPQVDLEKIKGLQSFVEVAKGDRATFYCIFVHSRRNHQDC